MLDHLDPALQAGLVREFGVDRFRFAHALVRDTAYAALSQSRRGRMHARVAEVLGGQPGRESEVARHWLAAGPQHADRAWRAARSRRPRPRVASTPTTRRSTLLTGAVDASSTTERAAADEDLFALLLELARRHLLTDNLVDLRRGRAPCARRGRATRRPDRAVAALGLLTTKALWQTGLLRPGRTRSSSDAAQGAWTGCRPATAWPAAGRWSSLASEIYYGSTHLEREALCERGARDGPAARDRRLLLRTLLAVPLGVWSPASADPRCELDGGGGRAGRGAR